MRLVDVRTISVSAVILQGRIKGEEAKGNDPPPYPCNFKHKIKKAGSDRAQLHIREAEWSFRWEQELDRSFEEVVIAYLFREEKVWKYINPNSIYW